MPLASGYSILLSLAALLGALGWAPAARSESLPPKVKVWDFESPTDVWVGKGSEAVVCEGVAESGRSSLRLRVNFPQPATVKTSFSSSIHRRLYLTVRYPEPASVSGEINMANVETITYHVFVPAGAPPDTRVLFYVKTKDGLWFQSVVESPLKHRQWVRIGVDLSEGSHDLTPGEHFGAWNRYTAEQITEIGVTAFSTQPYRGAIYLDHIVARGRGVGSKRRRARARLAMVNFRCDSAIARASAGAADKAASHRRAAGAPDEHVAYLYEKYEVSFELNRSFDNPFDPDQVAVDAVFTAPSGKTLTVPGFYYQGFSRTLSDDGREVLIPEGPGCWKVRFAPIELGVWTYFIKVSVGRAGKVSEALAKHGAKNDGQEPTDRSEEIVTEVKRFNVALPPSEAHGDSPLNRGKAARAAKGFIRVSRKDRRYFEFSNGDFFYPIGHSLHSPVDVRSQEHLGTAPHEVPGTYLYDTLIPKMAENGANLAEVWLSSWWLGLEWTEEWPFYNGVGRYNLQNAWKLDYILALAERAGLYLHLVLDNHGKASNWCDPEWPLSPYNEANRNCAGGFLNDPEMLFENGRAKRLYKQKLRYIAARWGYSSHIMGFELWSEIDLVGMTPRFQSQWGRAIKRSWFQEMARYLKKIDPWQHLVTIHYSTDYSKIDPAMASLPELDYVVVDAYKQKGSSPCIVPMIQGNYYATSRYKKPTFITEFGGSPWAASDSELKADLHAGLWAGFMTPHAGPPLFWWYAFVYREDLYFNFRALSRFAEGENLRGKGLERKTVGIEVDSSTPGASRAASRYKYRVRGMALKNRTLAYVWVYDRSAMSYMPEKAETYAGLAAVIRDLENGEYSIEIWDTYSGEIRERRLASTNSNRLSISLPDFQKDIALKIAAVSDNGPGSQ